jgi:hypothetical protein
VADQQVPQFSEADVQSLGQKLAEFSQILTPGEQAALIKMLLHAMPGESEAQGFSYSHLIDRKLLVVGLLDILYPNTFDGVSLESEVPSENYKIT